MTVSGQLGGAWSFWKRTGGNLCTLRAQDARGAVWGKGDERQMADRWRRLGRRHRGAVSCSRAAISWVAAGDGTLTGHSGVDQHHLAVAPGPRAEVSWHKRVRAVCVMFSRSVVCSGRLHDSRPSK
jgi:hypothetical protein